MIKRSILVLLAAVVAIETPLTCAEDATEDPIGPFTSGKSGKSSGKSDKGLHMSVPEETVVLEIKSKVFKSGKDEDGMSIAKAFKGGKSGTSDGECVCFNMLFHMVSFNILWP